MGTVPDGISGVDVKWIVRELICQVIAADEGQERNVALHSVFFVRNRLFSPRQHGRGACQTPVWTDTQEYATRLMDSTRASWDGDEMDWRTCVNAMLRHLAGAETESATARDWWLSMLVESH
jgi:hypothetical protein